MVHKKFPSKILSFKLETENLLQINHIVISISMNSVKLYQSSRKFYAISMKLLILLAIFVVASNAIPAPIGNYKQRSERVFL